MYTLLLCLVVLVVVLVVGGYLGKLPGTRGKNLPPGEYCHQHHEYLHIIKRTCNAYQLMIGPPCLPIIGNLHQLPPAGVHLKYVRPHNRSAWKRDINKRRFTEWAAKYGSIFSLKLGPSTAVVLSSPTAVKQLVDKQSAYFSNRPSFYIADELMMHGDHLMFMNTDQRWRRGRRLYHQYFNEGVSEREHVVVQQAEAVQLLRDMCLQPDDFMAHCKRYTNSVIMSLSMSLGGRLAIFNRGHSTDIEN